LDPEIFQPAMLVYQREVVVLELNEVEIAVVKVKLQ